MRPSRRIVACRDSDGALKCAATHGNNETDGGATVPADAALRVKYNSDGVRAGGTPALFRGRLASVMHAHIAPWRRLLRQAAEGSATILWLRGILR